MIDLSLVLDKIMELGLSDADLVLLIVIGIVVLVVTEKVSEVFYALLKKFLGFIIVALSVLAFVLYAKDQIFIQQDPLFLGLAALGGGISLVILINTIMNLINSYTKEVPELEDVSNAPGAVVSPKVPEQVAAQAGAVVTPSGLVEWKDFKNTIQDKSFLTVLSYAVVAQFGVFSGVTVTPPTPETGFVFFGFFAIAGFIFIRGAYSSYGKGLSHLILAIVANVLISVVLGHFWVNIPYETLLSFEYFKSTSLVAGLTGTAVGLFMSSKK